MYLSDQMLRNLAPRETTASQQRENDEYLGQIAAAMARWSHRVAARVQAVAALPSRHGYQPTAFRKADPTRHRAPHRASNGLAEGDAQALCPSGRVTGTVADSASLKYRRGTPVAGPPSPDFRRMRQTRLR